MSEVLVCCGLGCRASVRLLEESNGDSDTGTREHRHHDKWEDVSGAVIMDRA